MLWLIFWIALFLFFTVVVILLNQMPDIEKELSLSTNVVRAFCTVLMIFSVICGLISFLGMIFSFMLFLQTNGIIHIH